MTKDQRELLWWLGAELGATAALAVLRGLGIIHWAWYWIIVPLWAPPLIAAAVALSVVGFMIAVVTFISHELTLAVRTLRWIAKRASRRERSGLVDQERAQEPEIRNR